MWIDIAERSSNYFKKLRKVKRGDNVLRTNAFGECYANVFDWLSNNTVPITQ